MRQGLIALDIDGTLTTQLLTLPPRVTAFLNSIDHARWQIVFVTGRTFLFAQKVLGGLNFSYYIAVQNGAITIEMPSKRILGKKYISTGIFPELDRISRQNNTDYVIYTGFEYEDLVLYRKTYFSQKQLDYMLTRSAAFKERWREFPNYEETGINLFPSVKFFGNFSEAKKISEEIETELGLHVPLIKDPFRKDAYIAQATHQEVTKGAAVKELYEISYFGGKIIAAGDDYNDLSMLEIAHERIVMANSPKSLLDIATITAPPASQEGIIPALMQAINNPEGNVV